MRFRTLFVLLILMLATGLTFSGCEKKAEDAAADGEAEKKGDAGEEGKEGEAGEGGEAGKEGEEGKEGDNGDKAADGDKTADGDGTDTAAAVDAAAMPAGDALQAGVLKLLPANTVFVAYTPNLAQTTDDLGRTHFIEKFKEQYEQVVTQMKEDIGYNLLDPKEVSALGVKPDGVAGIAAIDVKTESFAFFIEVTDQTKLVETFEAFIAKEDTKTTREDIGDVVMLFGEEQKAAVLVTKEWMLLVGGGEPGEAVLNAARAIAAQDPAQSLAQSPNLQRALSGLTKTRHLVAYFSGEGLMSLAQSRDLERIAALEAQIKEMQGVGADANQIAFVQAEIDDRKSNLEEQLKATRMVFGNLGGIGMGVDASGKTFGVEIDLLTEKDGAAALLANAQTTPAILNATSEPPLALVSFNVVPDNVYDMFSKIVEAEGGNMMMVDQGVKAVTGMDLKGDILSNLSGEVGFMADAELKVDMKPSDILGGAVLGVKDPKKAFELLNTLAGLPQAEGQIVKDGETFKIKAPEVGEVYIRVAGNFITVSNDAEFADRVAKKDAKSFVAGLNHEALKSSLEKTEAAALIVFEPELFGWFLIMGDMKMESAMPPISADAGNELKAKYAELAALDAQIEEARVKEQAATNKVVMDMFEPLGTTAMFLRLTETGVELEAGQFMNAESMPALIDTLVDAGMGFAMSGGMDGEVDDLYNRRWELEDEIFRESMPQPVEMPKADTDKKGK